MQKGTEYSQIINLPKKKKQGQMNFIQNQIIHDI